MVCGAGRCQPGWRRLLSPRDGASALSAGWAVAGVSFLSVRSQPIDLEQHHGRRGALHTRHEFKPILQSVRLLHLPATLVALGPSSLELRREKRNGRTGGGCEPCADFLGSTGNAGRGRATNHEARGWRSV